jgi:hypothetical protein
VTACEGVDLALRPIVTSQRIAEGLMKQILVKEASINSSRRLR